jgi:hypothetical protein
MTKKPVLKIRKPPKAYPINFEKLKGESMGTLPYLLGTIAFSEDYEYFDKIKHLLIIPEPRKSLEEIQQELDEKFEELLVKTKRKFAVSKESAEYRYNQKFDRIIRDFEHAKTYGNFPTKITIGKLDYSTLTTNSTLSLNTEYRIGTNEVGYWSIQPNIKVYLERKPNVIVRYFSKLLLDFEWKSTK